MTLDAVTSKLLSTTDSGEWERMGAFELDFETDHPQGLIRVGDRYYLSTVRIPEGEPGAPDLSVAGKGFLIEVGREGDTGIEKRRLELSDGMVYHPGGLATDGESIYVPVSEYRPDSTCAVYKIDVETFEQVGDPMRFPDHLGALSIDPERKRIFGMSWAARRIYVWDYDWNLLYMNTNPIENVHYQDMDFVGGNTLACGGFSTHQLGDEQIEIGGIDLINATTWFPEHRIMVTTKTHTGRLLVSNALSLRLEYPDLFIFFVPDDDQHSRVEIYRV
jgi:hypothetical protein